MVMNPPTIPGGRGGRTAARSGPKQGSRRPGINDMRRSTCSRCGFGIFDGQPMQWSRNPLGLVHVECPDPAGAVS